MDPLSLKGMDILATILAHDKRSTELEALALQLISVSDTRSEPWVAMGYHYMLNRKLTRALYLAHKVGVLLIYFFYDWIISLYLPCRWRTPQTVETTKA